MCDILIIGCGSLGRAIAYLLGSIRGWGARLVLASRDPQAARNSAAVVNLRAKLLDCGTTADAVTLHWDTPGFLNELIESNKPKLIIHTASYQSAWEFGQGRCQWAALVRNAGY